MFGATVATALGATNAAHGFPEQDEKRKALNELHPHVGRVRRRDRFRRRDARSRDRRAEGEFVPDSTTGGPGDKLHPNRAGYLAMGNAIDLDMVMGKKEARRAAENSRLIGARRGCKAPC